MDRKRQIDFEFVTPPEPGYRLLGWTGQQYVLLAVEPWTRRSDGAATYVLTWQGWCHDCGATFEQKTGMRRSLNRRCHQHYAPMKPSTKTVNEIRHQRSAALKLARATRAAGKAPKPTAPTSLAPQKPYSEWTPEERAAAKARFDAERAKRHK